MNDLLLWLQKPSLNGEFSVYKLRQNSSKWSDYSVVDCDDSQHSHDLSAVSVLHGSTPPLDGSHKVTFNQHQWQGLETSPDDPLKADSLKSTDSDILSDELSPPTKHKVVAIDTSRNKHFSRRLLPVQSPEFDNVMDQVLLYRLQISSIESSGDNVGKD